jgi:hypothetical protein
VKFSSCASKKFVIVILEENEKRKEKWKKEREMRNEMTTWREFVPVSKIHRY